MWREVKVLLIDDNDQRRHDLHVILDFLGESTILTHSHNWLKRVNDNYDKSSQALTVIIGQCDMQGGRAKLLEELQAWQPSLPIVVVGRKDAVEQLPEDLRKMVIKSIEYPPSYNKLLDCLHKAQVYREQLELAQGKVNRQDTYMFKSLIGTSRQIKDVRELVAQVADKDVTVLITGESGTGKEVVARHLHQLSNRKDKPFVPVNCGAIPAELLESELFGHEKGAFTGAINAKPGRFELAEGGTLFLDEIGDMPLNMQVKILRVLQEHCYERVGGTKTNKTNVRIIAATHNNLEKKIEEGLFREDLYYRLNVFPIEMPALRERAEDIPLLLNELITKLEKDKKGSIRFNSQAIASLSKHEWHGNVRELSNLVERLAILHPQGVIGLHELPQKFRHLDDDSVKEMVIPASTSEDVVEAQANSEVPALLPVNGLDLKEYLTSLERNLIQQALDDSNGIVARAAERLHIRRTTLVEKMRKYGLQRKDVALND